MWAFFLGWGRGARSPNTDTAFTTPQQQAVDRCIKGGLRKFYFSGVNWSFLQPVASLSLASAANTAALPADFGGGEGRITVTQASGVLWGPLEFGSIGDVYQAESAFPATTGRPQMACVEAIKGTALAASSRSQLRVWPLADQAYTLKFRYYVNPDYLTGLLPYAYGGPEHAQTLLEACLAEAELILDDAATVHAQAFQQSLASSKDVDRRKKPENLGYAADHSDMKHRPGRASQHGLTPLRVGGVLYP